MDRKIFFWVTIVSALAFFGCTNEDVAANNPNQKPNGISLRLIREIDGFSVPECVVVDTSSGNIYVSNIVASDQKYWVDDNNGFISLLDNQGDIKELKWSTATNEMPIHAPKGMAILDGYLYFTDNNILKRVSLVDSDKVEQIKLPETKKLNDLATDGASVWVTDTGLGKVYKVEKDGSFQDIPAPQSTNGITCWKGQVFAVSWDLHEVYELDPTGKQDPLPFGVADYFTNLDGIEVLENGIFIVSDFKGNQVAAIMQDRKTVVVLAKLKSPADIGIDRQRNLLYIPMFLANKVHVYEICIENILTAEPAAL